MVAAMAQIQLRTPDPFNFRNPDEWPRWKQRYEQFHTASGLLDATQARQVNTLLYCMGEEAQAILDATNVTEDERKHVLGKFDDFFKVRKNIIFERARFNRRVQLGGETAEQFIMELHKLAENCEYGEKTNEMIRDRLVVGLRDGRLSERLQLDPELTLAKAEKMVRQSEAVHEQQMVLKGVKQIEVAEVCSEKGPVNNNKRTFTKHKETRQKSNGRSKGKCTRCGKDQHSKDKCPAKDAECYRCHKIGHYGAQCRSKVVAEVKNMDTAYLDMVTKGKEKAWKVEIQLEKEAIQFKMDTGAEVTAITEETYKLIKEPRLTRQDKQLMGPSKQALKVKGVFEGNLTYQERRARQSVYVVKGLSSNLLGLRAMTALNLISRVETIDIKKVYEEEFSDLFKGIGTLGEPYEVQLSADVKPHALYAPRRVPIPLRKKVKEELDQMERNKIISKVEEPTAWCAGMVVIPKKTGSENLCGLKAT